MLPVASRVFAAKTAAAVLRPAGFVPVTTAVSRATAFRVRNLTKVYGTGAGEVRALRGVDLDVQTGETIVLLGPSGSGKSTLLNVLGGLDRPTSGSVLFHDTDLAQLSDVELTRYRRQSVGFVFQFFNLMPSLTAGENVELISALGVEEQRTLVVLQFSNASACAGLAPGFRVWGRVHLRDAANGVLAPVGALVRNNGAWAVYRVEQGRARLRAVAVGTLTDRDAEIASGVDVGDRLIVYPSDRVTDGIRVRAQ
jgi:ABC-type Fe3+/spermidine/putrescine transport system ATPase subunit